jgi:nitrogen regulatory protein PII
VHALNEAGILGLTTYAVQGAGAQVGSSERYKGTEFTGGAATDALVEKVRSIHWSPYDRVRVVDAVS